MTIILCYDVYINGMDHDKIVTVKGGVLMNPWEEIDLDRYENT